jgi:hypothetical protein
MICPDCGMLADIRIFLKFSCICEKLLLELIMFGQSMYKDIVVSVVIKVWRIILLNQMAFVML